MCGSLSNYHKKKSFTKVIGWCGNKLMTSVIFFVHSNKKIYEYDEKRFLKI